jgi:hypothetical protein
MCDVDMTQLYSTVLACLFPLDVKEDGAVETLDPDVFIGFQTKGVVQ